MNFSTGKDVLYVLEDGQSISKPCTVNVAARVGEKENEAENENENSCQYA